MADAFSVELSMHEGPADAQDRAVTALIEPARAVGLRLNRRSDGELGYRPPVKFPLIVAMWHRLSGEHMTARFEPSADGGTRVTINGAVARGKHAIAMDPDHWREALGGSAPV
jgi:hypothetical protein